MPASSQESARKQMGLITGSVEPLVDNSTFNKESSLMPPPHQEKVERGKLVKDANSSWVSLGELMMR
jgi:hypothetical protein